MTDPVTAAWLRSEGLQSVTTNAGVIAWGTAAVESEVRCPFDQPAAAAAEGARQIAFLGPAKVIETIRVDGRQGVLIGQCGTITCDVEGYRAGATVFVIGVDELVDDDATLLRVVRRLA